MVENEILQVENEIFQAENEILQAENEILHQKRNLVSSKRNLTFIFCADGTSYATTPPGQLSTFLSTGDSDKTETGCCCVILSPTDAVCSL